MARILLRSSVIPDHQGHSIVYYSPLWCSDCARYIDENEIIEFFYEKEYDEKEYYEFNGQLIKYEASARYKDKLLNPIYYHTVTIKI